MTAEKRMRRAPPRLRLVASSLTARPRNHHWANSDAETGQAHMARLAEPLFVRIGQLAFRYDGERILIRMVASAGPASRVRG